MDDLVTVVPVAAGERAVLRHLVDLYAYDFSEILDIDIGDDGRFAFPDLDPYWTEGWRHPFFIRVGGKLAGFALVHGRSRLSGTPGVFDMAEFFVMRRYRRRRVGEAAARQLFARFAGPWEIRQRATNHAAIAFWRRVVDRQTGGRFREETRADDVWQGPVQSFTT